MIHGRVSTTYWRRAMALVVAAHIVSLYQMGFAQMPLPRARSVWVYPPTGKIIRVAPNVEPGGDGSLLNPLDLQTVFGPESPVAPGDTIALAEGVYEGKIEGTRRLPFEWSVSGEAGKPVLVMPYPGAKVHFNGGVEISGSHVWFINLEFGDLLWDPSLRTHTAPPVVATLSGTGIKFINCNLFGGAMGAALWNQARDLEMYGCLVHDFGVAPGAGAAGQGQGVFLQNSEGAKTLQHNVVYRGFGANLFVSSQGTAIRNVSILENMFFLPGGAAPDMPQENCFAAAALPIDEFQFQRNLLYMPTKETTIQSNARLRALRAISNGTALLAENHFIGGYAALSLGAWQKMTVVSNTIWAGQLYIEMSSWPTFSSLPTQADLPNPAAYILNKNTYLGNGYERGFSYGTARNARPEDRLPWWRWRELGFDADSALVSTPAGRPTGTKVFVFPNKYQENRAVAAVFNWDGLNEVVLDVSGIFQRGIPFSVRNCLDITTTISAAAPVVTGVFNGKALTVPLRKAPACPEFEVFLISAD